MAAPSRCGRMLDGMPALKFDLVGVLRRLYLLLLGPGGRGSGPKTLIQRRSCRWGLAGALLTSLSAAWEVVGALFQAFACLLLLELRRAGMGVLGMQLCMCMGKLQALAFVRQGLGGVSAHLWKQCGQTLRRKGCRCRAAWLLGMHELLMCMWPAGRRLLVAAGMGMEGPPREAPGIV